MLTFGKSTLASQPWHIEQVLTLCGHNQPSLVTLTNVLPENIAILQEFRLKQDFGLKQMFTSKRTEFLHDRCPTVISSTAVMSLMQELMRKPSSLYSATAQMTRGRSSRRSTRPCMER